MAAIATVLIAGALYMAAPATAATMDLGQVAPAGSSDVCFGCTDIQTASAANAPSVTVPAGSWTVTSWSIRSGTTTDGFDRLEIWRPEATNFRLIAQSNEESIVHLAGTGAIRTFNANIPVQAGDVLGIRTGFPPGDAAGFYVTPAAADVTWRVAGDPPLGQTVGPSGDITTPGITPMQRVNVAATISQPEPVVTPPAAPPAQKKRKCRRHKKRAASAKKKCKGKKRR